MLYIFDLDGTLRVTKSGRPAPNENDDQVLLPNVREKLRSLYDAGHVLTAASNQGGVSHGYMTEWECWRIQEHLDVNLGHVLADIRLNFYHSRGQYRSRYTDKRKPRPDLLIELLRDFPDDSILGHFAGGIPAYIGNQYTDRQAAQAANIYFEWAHIFFGWRDVDIVETEKGFFPREWFLLWQKRKMVS